MIDAILKKWKSKKRHMGCVAAAAWFCKRVPSFRPLSIDKWTSRGELYGHVVATDGNIVIDLAPYSDLCTDYKTKACKTCTCTATELLKNIAKLKDIDLNTVK